MHSHRSLYERDFYSWALESAHLLRSGKFNNLDTQHIAEEIENMARQEERELEHRFETLIAHLLKLRNYPEKTGNSNSWQATVKEQRFRINKLIRKNPGLKHKQEEIFEDAYKGATLIAAADMHVNEFQFPSVCPFTLEECLVER
jgi:hypothetical protein